MPADMADAVVITGRRQLMVDPMKVEVSRGDFQHFGASRVGTKAAFCFEAEPGKEAALVFYELASGEQICEVVIPEAFRIGRVCSVLVGGLDWRQVKYRIRIGHRIRMDAFAGLVSGREQWMDESRHDKNYEVYGLVPQTGLLWQEERRERLPAQELVMYRLHMRGFTMQQALGRGRKGNYKGIIAALPALSDMGITALEFMPIYEFEEIRFESRLRYTRERREPMQVCGPPKGTNYWGYGKAEYFAPKSAYFGGKDADVHLREMVRAIHDAGMEMVMELSFPEPVSGRFIETLLVYWVKKYHIDGFHLLGQNLDLAPAAECPYLSDTKIFYDHFSEELLRRERGEKHLFIYDEAFLYPLRRLQNHLDGSMAELRNQMMRQNRYYGFVNYVASSTGFTLLDAYSYGEKHNEANGEDNRDGSNYNCSFNYGMEGETKNRGIQQARIAAVRTALCAVLMAQGIPMINAGDERLNTQRGNNNPYGQDNAIGWVQFSKTKSSSDLAQYVKRLIEFRKKHSILSKPVPLQGSDIEGKGFPEVSYHGREPWILYGDIGGEKKGISILYNGAYGNTASEDILVAMNFYYGEELFALPYLPDGRRWYYVTNTLLGDWNEDGELLSNQQTQNVPGGSISIFVCRKLPKELRGPRQRVPGAARGKTAEEPEAEESVEQAAEKPKVEGSGKRPSEEPGAEESGKQLAEEPAGAVKRLAVKTEAEGSGKQASEEPGAEGTGRKPAKVPAGAAEKPVKAVPKRGEGMEGSDDQGNRAFQDDHPPQASGDGRVLSGGAVLAGADA